MKEKKQNLGSDLKKVDAHHLSQSDYAENPALTDEWFANADLYEGQKLVQRGRPKASVTKKHITIRFSPDVVDPFRDTGRGWQTRMERALRDWLKYHQPQEI